MALEESRPVVPAEPSQTWATQTQDSGYSAGQTREPWSQLVRLLELAQTRPMGDGVAGSAILGGLVLLRTQGRGNMGVPERQDPARVCPDICQVTRPSRQRSRRHPGMSREGKQQ